MTARYVPVFIQYVPEYRTVDYSLSYPNYDEAWKVCMSYASAQATKHCDAYVKVVELG